MLAILLLLSGLTIGVFQYRKRRKLPENYQSTPTGLFLLWAVIGIAAVVGTFLVVVLLPNNTSTSERFPMVPLPKETTNGKLYYVGESYPLPDGRPVHSFIVNQHDETVFRSDLIIHSKFYIGGDEAYTVYVQPRKFYPLLFPLEFTPSQLVVNVHVPEGSTIQNYHLDILD